MSATPPSPSGSRLHLHAGAIQNPYSSISVVLPEGQVDDEAAGLLHEFVRSHTHTPIEGEPTTYEIGGVQIDKIALEAQRLERAARPWWRRPSATWLIVLSPLTMLAVSALVAPRLVLYTCLMCKDLDPGPWNPENGGAEPDLRAVMSLSRPVPCAADPVVQANVAKLLAITQTVQGILSCLTAPFWGSFSDRYGRVPFLSLNITTLLVSDAALAALAIAPAYVPGGYWSIVYVSAFEGLFGGRGAAVAAAHAYLADCSDSVTRSRIFSRFLGLIFIGMAFGPSLGGLAQHLSGDPYTIFYLALSLHAINALFMWIVVPESLLPAQMDAARRAREKGSNAGWFSRIFSFLAPLAVLAPVPRKGSASPQKAFEKDWSLTWVALSYAPESLIVGGLQYWLQYAAGRFDWTAEIVAYYISFVGITRALFLVVGLPAILHLCARRSRPIQLPTSPDEALDASRHSPQPRTRAPSEPRDRVHEHTPVVDLGLAKVSLALQVVCFLLTAVSKDAAMFVAASAFGAFAAGYSPTVHSLSLELYTRRDPSGDEAPPETGRLFGAMSVIQTIGSQIAGPTMFGIVYIDTVATFPEAMFYVGMAVASLSLFFLFLVQIPPDRDAPDSGAIIVDTEAEAPASGHS